MCTWQLESGGDWNALNPSTRADNRYQMMPSTWAADGGTEPPQDGSPAKQPSGRKDRAGALPERLGKLLALPGRPLDAAHSARR
jgi:hypothetical protein